MISKPTREFAQLLAQVMAGYGKPLPDAVIVQSWWTSLSPFPGHVVREAFSAYSLEKPDFAPVPNSIAARCVLLDGRPGPEEAYALCLRTLDEQVTVVWTQECATAFARSQAVLEASGAISARKAFIEIYERLVASARHEHQPATWFVSPGLDKIGYTAAIKQAVIVGLLPAPAEMLRIEAGESTCSPKLNPHEQLAFIKKQMLDGIAEKQRRADEEIDARNLAKDGEEQAISAEIQRKVDQHQSGGAT